MPLDEPTSPQSSRRNRQLILLCVLLYVTTLVPLAVVVRWGAMQTREGSSFAYWPDGLEYAAGAQAIADSGEYYLQVGPHRVRPRYSPGFSMFLAPWLWLGLDPTDLWRIPAVIAGLQAVLIAVAVMLLLQFLSCRGLDDLGWVPGVSGFLGGLVWSMAPISVDVGRVPMSDEVGAFFANLALFCAVIGFLTIARARSILFLWIAGLSLGVAASIRSIEGILLIPPLLLLFLAAHRLHGNRAGFFARSSWFVVGYLLPTGMTCYLLYRSGFNPWTWSAYEYWTPEWYEDLGKTFAVQYAIHGEASRPLLDVDTGEELGFLWIPAHIFLGFQRTAYYGFGTAWSWLGLPALLLVVYRVLVRVSSHRWVGFGVVLAFVGWMVGHVVVYSSYFFHSERFYIAAAASWSMVLSAGLGLAYLLLRGFLRYLLPLVFLLFLYGEIRGIRRIWAEPWHGMSPEVHEVRARIGPWLDLSDAVRSGIPIPFDTVLAQALGLLPKEVTKDIGPWGSLTDAYYHSQVVRIRERLGSSIQKSDEKGIEAPVASSYPTGTRVLGETSLRVDAADQSLRFRLRSPSGESLLEYRIPLRPGESQGSLRVEELHLGLGTILDLTPRSLQGQEFHMELLDWKKSGALARIRYLIRFQNENLFLLTSVLELRGRSLRVRLVSKWPFGLQKSIVLGLHPFPVDKEGVHLASHWDWFASQANRVSARPLSLDRQGDPILAKHRKLSSRSLGTFYVTVSEDARDLEIVMPSASSPYASLLLEAPLLLSRDPQSFSGAHKKLVALRLPAPLRIAEDPEADILLLDPMSPSPERDGSVGSRLRGGVASLRAAGEARPVAANFTKDAIVGMATALGGAADLVLLGPQATLPERRASRPRALWVREIPIEEDPLDRARRLRMGVLPVYRVGPKADVPWSRLLSRQVYLELPLQRAIHESVRLSESQVGGEGRLLQEFENGLRLWLNLAAVPWNVVVGNESYRLGRGGYLAISPKGLVAGFMEDEQSQTTRFLRGVGGITAKATPGRDIRFSVRDQGHQLAYQETRSGLSFSRLPQPATQRFSLGAEGAPRLGLGQKRLRLRLLRVVGGLSAACRWDSIAWKSLDSKVASVDRYGVVRVHGEGVARIRATLEGNRGAAEISLPASSRPILSGIRQSLGPAGLALGFSCDRPCPHAGVLIRTPGRPDEYVLATRDPSWMSFQLWVPASSLQKSSTLILIVRDQFGLDGASEPFSAGR